MTLPSTTTASPAALARATCDGEGLITFLTENGPEHFACLGCRHCTPGAMPITTTTPHAGTADLLARIRKTGSRAELVELWKANLSAWTPWHTKVAAQRLVDLRLAELDES